MFYFAITMSFTSSFINIALLITGIFILIQCCGRIDESLGFGKYSANTETTLNKEIAQNNAQPDDDGNDAQQSN